MSLDLYKKLKSIEDAISYEIDQHYINAKGNKSTFSNFIIQNTRSLSSQIEDKSELKSLINLFYTYPTQDINTRMQTIHKAQDILRGISKKNKRLLKENIEVKPAKTSFEKNIKKIDVKYVKGVGPKISLILNRLEIFTVFDLFTYFPRAYIDYKTKSAIRDLKMSEDVTVSGKVKNITCFDPPRNKSISIISISIFDETGKLKINKFSSRKISRMMLRQYKKQFPEGSEVVCAGTVAFDKFSKSFTLANPIIEPLNTENSDITKSEKIVPVYPLTEGIALENLRKIISNAFETYGEEIKESLPASIIKEFNLLDLKTSIKQLHFPESNFMQNTARNRIAFEEFFVMQLQLAFRRYFIDKDRQGLNLKNYKEDLVKKLVLSLPFKLTNAQERVVLEIKKDLTSNKPMHRLLQGDVGSGKTIVALLSMLFVVENDMQSALMAPTEILVHQHAMKLREYLNPLGINVAELTGSTPNKIKKEIYSGLETGQIKIIVGTHALIQEDIKFKNLGLAVIDEQHRFGVKQRDDLLKKGRNVERLFMTATPIPRTLALSMHGDLEMSEIDELPPGRIPIKTSIVQPWQRSKAFDLIKGELSKGKQSYIVFPLIDESEALAAKAASIEFEELSKSVFKNFRLGLMHGELPSSEKDETMKKFINKELDILISTTVIEVGVDVSNATVMMIENAERFGLSQLHQLRGRIGRGGDQAYCLLIPQNYSEDIAKRLDIMTKTTNGFIISQEDLKIRGPGEFLGTKQSGLPDFKIADLIRDANILELARKKATEIINSDPAFSKYPEIKNLLEDKANSYITAG